MHGGVNRPAQTWPWKFPLQTNIVRHDEKNNFAFTPVNSRIYMRRTLNFVGSFITGYNSVRALRIIHVYSPLAIGSWYLTSLCKVPPGKCLRRSVCCDWFLKLWRTMFMSVLNGFSLRRFRSLSILNFDDLYYTYTKLFQILLSSSSKRLSSRYVFSCVICFRFIHFILISTVHALFLTCLPVSIYGT